MTPLEKEVISVLRRNPDSTAQGLSKYLSVNAGYATVVLMRLALEGMVSFRKEKFRNGFRRLWRAAPVSEKGS